MSPAPGHEYGQLHCLAVFAGGSIGTLAVHGTVNDISMLGAEPRWLSCAFILEEGLPLAELEKVVADMGEAARNGGRLLPAIPRLCPKAHVTRFSSIQAE